MDAEVDGLLRGLTGRARTERAELVEWLLARGFGIDQIRSSVVPTLLPANRVIGDDGSRVSVRELAARTGVDEELLRRLHRAVGLARTVDADAAPQSRADAESVLRAAGLVDLGFDADALVAIVRDLVEGFERAAETMRKAALKAVLRPGATEAELAGAFEELAVRIAPVLGPMVEDLLHLQLRRSFETEAVNIAERTAGTLPGARFVTAAFADMVGFTELGERLLPEQLELLANRLADLARDVVIPPVRFVKSIGDAVMFVSTEPRPLLDVLLTLVSRAQQTDLPALRVGVASGWAVSHAGDWIGSPVNLASRITDAARPGAVVVPESSRRYVAASADIEWTALGSRRLKGIGGEIALFEVRYR